MTKVYFVSEEDNLLFASVDEDEAREYADARVEANVDDAREALGYDDDDYSEQHAIDAAIVAGESYPITVFSLDVPNVLVSSDEDPNDMDVSDWVDADDEPINGAFDRQEIIDFCSEQFESAMYTAWHRDDDDFDYDDDDTEDIDDIMSRFDDDDWDE